MAINYSMYKKQWCLSIFKNLCDLKYIFLASDGPAEKRPKVEVSKDELWSHVQKGTLGKLTVPVLKDACRFLGLRGGSKKQEFMDALTEYFSER